MIETFQPDRHQLLGAGVWGSVYDLGDSSVLKLAKEQGGIGDGRQKINHEIMVMLALQASEATADKSFLPRMIASGSVPETSELYDKGYSVWLQSTKLSGDRLFVQDIASRSDDVQKKIAHSLGTALAEFHAVLRASGIAKELHPDRILTEPDIASGISHDDQSRLEKIRYIIAQSSEDHLKPIHGDFNISNMLFDNDLRVSGVLDFAETCLGEDEDDLCSLTSEMPFLKAGIIEAYEGETGRTVSQEKLIKAEAKRDLISLLICRYRIQSPDAALRAQERLDKFLANGPKP